MMELYHNNMLVCSQKVRRVLREKNFRPSEHNLAKNPGGYCGLCLLATVSLDSLSHYLGAPI